MNSNYKTITNLTFFMSMVTAIFAISFSSTAFAQNELDAKLTGKEEVPPVQTQATGTAILYPMGDSLHFIVNATNIKDVTAGHVHSGNEGENGPIIAILFQYNPPQNGVDLEDMIASDRLGGPMQGKQITDLIREMNNGNTYVNIHTSSNPNGEIRGQITGFAEYGQQ